MLDKNALSQLSQLKTTIVSQKDVAEGTVRGTPKRYGFIQLDDGRDAFIDPEQMLRVLPGDRVRVNITENDKKQLNAQLEALLESPLKTFVGRYVKKGSTHFVEPDLPPYNRWLFIPPHERTNCIEGDLVECQVIRHPFHHNGKAQIRINNRIGRLEEAGIEGRYITSKFKLNSQRTESELEEAHTLAVQEVPKNEKREDLTALPFITIDSEFTRDMDDAIYAEKNEDGWLLITAIADPSCQIHYNSALDLSARKRASTLYLLGHSVTMLPGELSHNTYSLIPNEVRPAIVCRMNIKSDGTLSDYQFCEAIISSQHKLSYIGVSALLEPNDATAPHIEVQNKALPKPICDLLHELKNCAAARLQYRVEHALVMEDRADFQYWLNDQKKIESIEKRTRNIAQKIIEEAMLATNICAGNLFKKHPNSGLYSTHAGFRAERLEDAKQLIKKFLPDYLRDGQDFSSLPVFQALFKYLRKNSKDENCSTLLSLLQRLQQAATLSAKPLSHFGLGFDTYAMVTSPIRRYQDLFNHYVLKAILNNKKIPHQASDIVEHLQSQLMLGRQAGRQLERWLLCQYMEAQLGSVHLATVRSVVSKGINVMLNDIGTEGFVLLAIKGQEKPKFNSGLLTLTTATDTFSLDQTIAVKVISVDTQTRQISLELVERDIADRLSVWTS